MSDEALIRIAEWMSDGGRVVVTGSSQHGAELEKLLELPLGSIDFLTSNEPVFNEYAPTAMPERLLVSEMDSSSSLMSLPLGASTFELQNDGIKLVNIYGTYVDQGQEMISASAATQFSVNRGTVIQISSNFSGQEPSVSWSRLLLASVYGTPTRDLSIYESNKSWRISGSDLYWNEMLPAGIVSVGDQINRSAIRCVNVPSSPSIRKVTEAGTEIKCGGYKTFDGVTDSGIALQLNRFFSASAAWAGSKVEITNLDSENSYSNSVFYGGSHGQETSMQIEATNEISHNLSSLGANWQEPPHWYTTSSGESISRDADGPVGTIVTTVLGTDGFVSYGGTDRNSIPLLRNEEILSEKRFELDDLESMSFSFFTGLSNYAPGCDRMAIVTAQTAADALNSQFDPDERWPDFSEINLPSLSTSACDSFLGQVSGISISQRNDVVSVSWPRLLDADMYELQFQLLGQDSWSSSLYQSSSDANESVWNFTNLNEGSTYNFRIRPIEINRNSSNDTANGRWLFTDPGFTVEGWSSPTPSPSPSTASPTPTPTPTQTVAPSPTPTPSASQTPVKVVVKKTQVTPTVPKTRKVKQTIKFTMKTKAGLALTVSSTGACKTTKITVKKKVGSKFVVTQTGWLVTATKKGTCSIRFRAKGNTTRKPLDVTMKVSVK
jgi:hypothetical protein